MQKGKAALPVYDICALGGKGHLREEVVAESFAEYLKVHPNLHKAHGHSFYHLVVFTKGSGHHTIDFVRFPVKAGQAYFMVPGQVHSWEFEGDVDGFVVNFSDGFFKTFLADDNYLSKFPFWNGVTGENVIQLSGKVLENCVAILALAVQETRIIDALQHDKLDRKSVV